MSKGIKNFYGNGNDSSSDDDYLRPNSGIVIPPSPQRDSESDMDCSSDEDLLSLRHKLQKKTINNDYDKENVKTVDSFSSEDEKPLALTKAPLKDIKNKQNIKTNEEASLKTSRTLGVKRRLPLTIIQGVKPKPVKTVSFLTSPAPSSTSVQPLKQLQSETGKKQNLLGSSISLHDSAKDSLDILLEDSSSAPNPALNVQPPQQLRSCTEERKELVSSSLSLHDSANDSSDILLEDSSSAPNLTDSTLSHQLPKQSQSGTEKKKNKVGSILSLHDSGIISSSSLSSNVQQPIGSSFSPPSCSTPSGKPNGKVKIQPQKQLRSSRTGKVSNQPTEQSDSDTDALSLYSSEDDEPPVKKGRRSKKKDRLPDNYTWLDADIDEQCISELPFHRYFDHKEPSQYFSYYFDKAILTKIVEESNKYSMQRDEEGVSMELTLAEIKVFIAIWIFMGISRLSCYEDYWKSPTRVPLVADNMSLKRFKLIRARLHLVDNDEIQTDDPLAKVRPLMEHIKSKCQALKQQTAFFSIDESIQPYKGCKAGGLRQYVKNKPHKWGFKSFMLAASSGIVFDFLIYSGSNTFLLENVQEVPGLGIGGNIVVHLSRSIQKPRVSAVCFDNYFTSIPTIQHLNSFGLKSAGTIRSDRCKGCPLTSDKELLKSGRGSSTVRSCDDVAIVKWADNRCVTMAGTWAGVEPEREVRRWDRSIKQKIGVLCPRIIQNYNKYMGGVDLFDMLMHLNRIPSKSKRWPFSLMAYMLDISLVNSFLTYCHDRKIPMTDARFSSKDFRLKVVLSLLSSSKKKSVGRPSPDESMVKKICKPVAPRPPDVTRYDGLDHVPDHAPVRQRCRFCRNGFTTVICLKCNMNLCLVKDRNCFKKFHQNDLTSSSSHEADSDAASDPDADFDSE